MPFATILRPVRPDERLFVYWIAQRIGIGSAKCGAMVYGALVCDRKIASILPLAMDHLLDSGAHIMLVRKWACWSSQGVHRRQRGASSRLSKWGLRLSVPL